jgi:hypothetical protein
MGFGILDDGGRAIGGFDLVPFSGGRVVEGDVTGLPGPLAYQPTARSFLQSAALTFHVPDEGGLVFTEGGACSSASDACAALWTIFPSPFLAVSFHTGPIPLVAPRAEAPD